MKKDFNPFPVSSYRGPNYFCDREKELHQLREHLKNGVNTTLFSIRRLGKTGLIHHLFDTLKQARGIACIYVDILGTNNVKEFTSRLATAIYSRFPEKMSIGKKITALIQSLRPVISYDYLTGQPEISFEAGETRKAEKTIEQLFNFLDKQKIKIVFAIDEFQQILEYPEKNMEAMLRTCIQNLKNTNFIFCGSNQKLMHEIFNNSKKPFFASCTNMNLGLIEEKKYATFIRHIFKKDKREVDEESIAFILDWTGRHTFYTQFFCNYLYSLKINLVRLADAQQAAAEILIRHEDTFYQYKNLVTSSQWNLLAAIASETKLERAHSKEFIKKYHLGTSSLVTRGIEALLQKQLIYQNTAVAKPYFEVYDKFLMRWLQKHN